VGTAGIEVKIAGQPGRVVEQLRRYAEHDRIDELVLVTSRVRHQAPGALNGKP
jgi:alkanesulfonate monooxygenase SsuD/methylene tetrahydromethanopterin reductase-like flavin-dependent oxidoreductase (luciferase family)